MKENIDVERTLLFDCPKVEVLSGKGDENNYYIIPKQSYVSRCPKCGRDKLLDNGYASRTFNDFIQLPDGHRKYITVHMRLKKYLCAYTACKHAFTTPVRFIRKGARNSIRLENLIIQTCMYHPFIDVPQFTGGAVSHTGAKKIFRRWLEEKDINRKVRQISTVGLHACEIAKEYRLFITGFEDEAPYLLDVLPDTSTSELSNAFQYIDTYKIQYIAMDMTESVHDFVHNNVPQAIPLILPETVMAAAQEFIRDAKSSQLTDGSGEIQRSLRELLRANNIQQLLNWRENISAIYPDFAPFAALVALLADEIKNGVMHKAVIPSYYCDDLAYFENLSKRTYGCGFDFVRARLLYQIADEVKIAGTPYTSFDTMYFFVPFNTRSISHGIPLRSLIARLEEDDSKITKGEL